MAASLVILMVETYVTDFDISNNVFYYSQVALSLYKHISVFILQESQLKTQAKSQGIMYFLASNLEK